MLLLLVVAFSGAVAETIAAGAWHDGGDDDLALLQTSQTIKSQFEKHGGQEHIKQDHFSKTSSKEYLKKRMSLASVSAFQVRRGVQRQVGSGIQVLGAGLERTGTESLNAALIMMGFNASHGMEDVYLEWESFTTWRCGGWDAKREWLQARSFTALTDNPYRAYFQELMEEYPDMQVILTVHPRGVEGWVNSTFNMFGLAEPAEKYVSWNQHVIDTVPKEKLLVFSPEQGFPVLAPFLGLPEPQAPYPHINQKELYIAESRESEFKSRLFYEGCPDGSLEEHRWF